LCYEDAEKDLSIYNLVMRLLTFEGNQFILDEFYDDDIPPYAILSHTWHEDRKEEVSFRGIVNGRAHLRAGFAKLQFCAREAARDDLQHFWIDTCCIDKSSSVELNEAINSMFSYYGNAKKCYVFLSDVEVPRGTLETLHTWEYIRKSRWFTRGWTLQELLAPNDVHIYDHTGRHIGTKAILAKHISVLTGIDERALHRASLSEFSVEERFSWIAGRRTRRLEDRAYCLLGIFDVRMRLDYGEGEEAAFARLRKKISKLKPVRAKLRPFQYRSYVRPLGKALAAVLILPLRMVATLLRWLIYPLSLPSRLVKPSQPRRETIFSTPTSSMWACLLVAVVSATIVYSERIYFKSSAVTIESFWLISLLIALPIPLSMSLIDPPKLIVTRERRCFMEIFIFISTYVCTGFLYLLAVVFLESVGPSVQAGDLYWTLFYLIFYFLWLYSMRIVSGWFKKSRTPLEKSRRG
jgi:hypothetical protein